MRNFRTEFFVYSNIALAARTTRWLPYENGVVYLNGNLLNEDYIMEHMNTVPADALEITVPDGYLFVMGDNRNHSRDSRNEAIGLINQKDILGKAVFRISPFSNLGKVK